MSKFTVFGLICVIALGACSALPAPTNSVPTVDIAGTVNSIAQTSLAQTLTAQPSPTATLVPDTATPPLAEPSATSTSVPIINTDTPLPNLTTTLATATEGVAAPLATATQIAVSGSPTLTPTLGILTYGTLPPAIVPYTSITLINRSQRQVYVSLQVVTDKGGPTIIEYPVRKTVSVKIPVGSYTYVVWVGGRQLVGYFHVSKLDEPTLTIYKDKIVIN
jgi:hypothetical protein